MAQTSIQRAERAFRDSVAAFEAAQRRVEGSYARGLRGDRLAALDGAVETARAAMHAAGERMLAARAADPQAAAEDAAEAEIIAMGGWR